MFKKKADSNNKSFEGTTKDKNTQPGEISIIGENMLVKGEITSTSSIRIDGTIEGNINSEMRIIVGSKGCIKGNLTAASADIEGSVYGKIEVATILNIKASAFIEAETLVGEISIEKGAKFQGNCKYHNKNEHHTIENNNQTE